MTNRFVARYPVRFGEIDHAGVMYYPAIFDRIHRAFEDFWPEACGLTYAQLLKERGVGFPVVSLSSNFSAPFRFGDELEIDFALLAIGVKSLRFRVRLFGAGETKPRAEAELCTAVIDMNRFSAQPLPSELREKLQPYLLESKED